MLHSEWRPDAWAGFIGNGKAIQSARNVLTRWLDKRAAGRAVDGLAIQIAGGSGTGKTTAALILAREAGALDGFDTLELDGDKCDVAAVRALEQSGGFFSTRPMGKTRVLIINESQNITPRAVQALLTLLERLPKWALVLFTTTSDSATLFGDANGPFTRRCVCIEFSNQGLAPLFAARAREIAAAEGLTLTDAQALRLVQDNKNNLGKVISEIERMAGMAVAA